MSKVKVMKPAATIKDTLIMLEKEGCACTTTLPRGLRITLNPGQWISISRPNITPSATEIRIVSEQAVQMGMFLPIMSAKPGALPHTIVWDLRKVELNS